VFVEMVHVEDLVVDVGQKLVEFPRTFGDHHRAGIWSLAQFAPQATEQCLTELLNITPFLSVISQTYATSLNPLFGIILSGSSSMPSRRR
jgi:hypothetical protein